MDGFIDACIATTPGGRSLAGRTWAI